MGPLSSTLTKPRRFFSSKESLSNSVMRWVCRERFGCFLSGSTAGTGDGRQQCGGNNCSGEREVLTNGRQHRPPADEVTPIILRESGTNRPLRAWQPDICHDYRWLPPPHPPSFPPSLHPLSYSFNTLHFALSHFNFFLTSLMMLPARSPPSPGPRTANIINIQ